MRMNGLDAGVSARDVLVELSGESEKAAYRMRSPSRSDAIHVVIDRIDSSKNGQPSFTAMGWGGSRA